MNKNSLLVLLPLLLATSCTTYSFGHRDRQLSPDERLEKLLDAYDSSHEKGHESNSNILVDPQRTRAAIEHLSLEYPTHVPTLMACGALAYDAHEIEKSQGYLDRLFGLQEGHPAAGVLRSRIAVDEGNLPFARRILEMQVQYAPDHSGVREALSGVLYMQGDFAGARAAISAAEALGAPGWRVAYHRGLIAEAAGDAAEAERQYQGALDANPDFTTARARLSGVKAQTQYNGSQHPPGKVDGG